MFGKVRKIRKAILAAICTVLVVALVASGCGAKETGQPVPVTDEGLKLPPSVVEAGGLPNVEPERTDAKQITTGTTENTATSTSRGEVRDFGGCRFTISKVSRLKENGDVSSSQVRKVKGDYLEVELVLENIGDDFLDPRYFEFRIKSPGIETETYSWDNPFGRSVDDNTISTTLLDNENLTPVNFSLKIGEVYDKGFLFFDLNPKNVSKNTNFVSETATLIIYKLRGEGSGEKEEISLAGLIVEE